MGLPRHLARGGPEGVHVGTKRMSDLLGTEDLWQIVAKVAAEKAEQRGKDVSGDLEGPPDLPRSQSGHFELGRDDDYIIPIADMQAELPETPDAGNNDPYETSEPVYRMLGGERADDEFGTPPIGRTEESCSEVPPEVAELVRSGDEIRKERDGVEQPTILPRDRLLGQLVDIGRTGLESTLWKGAEVAAAGLHPLGPCVVRGLYLSKQVIAAFKGMQAGDGFYFKVAVPGLNLPMGLELVFRVRLSYKAPSVGGGYGFGAEIQVFEPWLPDQGVKHRLHDTAEKLASGVLPARTPESSSGDPWRVWLVLIGDQLIGDLAEALAAATHLSAGEILAGLRVQRSKGWSAIHTIPDAID